MDKKVIEDGKNRGKKLSLASKKADIATLKRMFKWASGTDEDVNLSIFNVKFKKSENTEFSYLTPYDTFSTRQKDLEKYQIDESKEGAYRKLIYSKKELADNLQYLKQTQWDDGTFDSRRLFVAVLVVTCTGARRSELCRVKRKDIDLPNKAITIWMRKGSKDAELKPHRRELLEDTIPFLKALLFQTPQ